MPDTLPEPKLSAVCKQEGCKKKLSYNNSSGYCRAHGGRDRVKRNGAAPTAAKSPRANGAQPVAAHRVELLLAAIPLEDKLRLCSAWLAGK